MKRLLLLAVMICASAIAVPSAQAPAQVGPHLGAAIAAINATIEADFEKDGVGGLSIGVVSGKQLIWSKHYGYADAEAKRVADDDTTYRVGSITKQFTALALLQLVENSRMRLSDPLEKYVPEVKQVKSPPAGTPPITILQVATMTSFCATTRSSRVRLLPPPAAVLRAMTNSCSNGFTSRKKMSLRPSLDRLPRARSRART